MEALNRYVKESLSSISATADAQAKALAVLCFISHDENVYFNPDAERFDWKEVVTVPPVSSPATDTPPSALHFSGKVPQWLSDALNHIPCDDYSVWLAVGSALKSGGYPVSVWDEWSQRSDKYRESEISYKWKAGFDRIPFEYIERKATSGGWTAPWGSIARTILHPKPVSADDGWHDHQDALNKAFQSDAQFVLIRSDPGVGKDYAKASYILDKPPDAEKFVEMVPRVKLGTEKAAALIERSTTDRQVFQWMSIFTGWKENGHLPWHERMTLLGEPNGLMCVQARKYNALWLKGVNPQRALCPRCPKETLCNQVGYRSQTRKAAQSEYLITAQDGILFDKALQGFAKRIIGPKKRKKTGVIDEVRAHELFTECILPKSVLQFIGKAWSGTPAGQFAIDMINALEHSQTPNLHFVKKRVLNLSEMERRQITESFSRIRVQGQVFSDKDDKIWIDGVMKASGRFYPEFHPAGKTIAIATNESTAEELSEEGIPSTYSEIQGDKILLLEYQRAIALGFFEIPEVDDESSIKESSIHSRSCTRNHGHLSPKCKACLSNTRA